MMFKVLSAVVAVAFLVAPAVSQQSANRAQAQSTEKCKIYDSDGDEIWSGPCMEYLDTCTESSPPNCPTEPCSAGEPGDVKNGDKCKTGTATKFSGGKPVETLLICYCDVPVGAVANPAVWLLGLVFGFRLFRRRVV